MATLMKFFTTLLIICTLLACQPENNYSRFSGYTMGTTYQVTLETNEINVEKLQAEIDSRLKEINQMMSTYIDDSELSLFNTSQSTECQKLSADTLYVIEHAIKVSTQTQGKFDVTLAPLIEIWGFDKKETNNEIPSQTAINQLKNEIGYQKIELQADCARKQLPQLSVNLSAIAKGYAVDEIAKLILQQGSENYLVEIGGEVANRGVNAKGLAWRIAIESASTAQRSIQRKLQPKGFGIATSGSYRNYFEKNGKRYSHTIDPTTGYPIEHTLVSVTVLHPQTMMADAIATAMMVMGPEQSLAFADENNLPIFMLVKKAQGFEEVHSEAFKAYLD